MDERIDAKVAAWEHVQEARQQFLEAQSIKQALDRTPAPEPNWRTFDPRPATATLSPSEPLGQPPLWMGVPPAAWIAPRLAEPLPAGTGPAFELGPQPASLFDDNAPAQPVVTYPDGHVEALALTVPDVLKAAEKGAEIVWEGGRYVVRIGSKVLGPLGVLGTVKDLYDFNKWLQKQNSQTQPVRTRYELSTNTLLYEHPGGVWRPYPPLPAAPR